jgi:hypothetical protein
MAATVFYFGPLPAGSIRIAIVPDLSTVPLCMYPAVCVQSGGMELSRARDQPEFESQHLLVDSKLFFYSGLQF